VHDSDGGAQTKDIGQEPRVEIHLDALGVVTGGEGRIWKQYGGKFWLTSYQTYTGGQLVVLREEVREVYRGWRRGKPTRNNNVAQSQHPKIIGCQSLL
jgi:hypothetical protein